MAPIRLGIVGCGAIAQVHHLPNLMSLQEEFEVAVLCDVSPGLAQAIAADFNVPVWTTDYRELLDSDVEAVLLCQTDPKTDIAVEAFAAGKHVFIEKPMCFSLQEADRIIGAQQQAGTLGQMGYMKVFDPAYEIAREVVEGMDSIRFVQVNHLHTGNEYHLRHLRLKKFDDIPASIPRPDRQTPLQQALGPVEEDVAKAFFTLSGSMIHDLYGLRLMLGQPERVVSTELWNGGRGINTVLAYANGARCTASWVSLPGLWDFQESLQVYAEDQRAIVTYPTGFARGIPSGVVVQGVDSKGRSYRTEPAVEWENPFWRELRHFHACIRQGDVCRTPVDEARADIELIINIVKTYIS